MNIAPSRAHKQTGNAHKSQSIGMSMRKNDRNRHIRHWSFIIAHRNTDRDVSGYWYCFYIYYAKPNSIWKVSSPRSGRQQGA